MSGEKQQDDKTTSGDRVLIERIEAVMKCLGPCDHFDHHGDCQAHFLENPCSVGLLAQSLKDLKSKQAEV